MATTKTLTPTNQAITLADFTEKPDNRTNVTNDDKLADAVNALNSNMATLTYTGTVDSLQTSLVSLASNMSVGEFRNIKYTAGETLAPFRNTRIYCGTFKRTGSNYWSVTLEDPEGVPIYGTYRNSRWSWEPLALDSNKQAKLLSKTISATTDATGDVSLDLATETYVPVAFHISGGAVSKSASMLFMQNGNGTNWWIKFVSDSTLQNEANKTVEGTLYYFST